jgi:hypothetical protein
MAPGPAPPRRDGFFGNWPASCRRQERLLAFRQEHAAAAGALPPVRSHGVEPCFPEQKPHPATGRVPQTLLPASTRGAGASFALSLECRGSLSPLQDSGLGCTEPRSCGPPGHPVRLGVCPVAWAGRPRNAGAPSGVERFRNAHGLARPRGERRCASPGLSLHGAGSGGDGSGSRSRRWRNADRLRHGSV